MCQALGEGILIKITLFKPQKVIWVLFDYSHSSAEETEAKGGDVINM